MSSKTKTIVNGWDWGVTDTADAIESDSCQRARQKPVTIKCVDASGEDTANNIKLTNVGPEEKGKLG